MCIIIYKFITNGLSKKFNINSVYNIIDIKVLIEHVI